MLWGEGRGRGTGTHPQFLAEGGPGPVGQDAGTPSLDICPSPDLGFPRGSAPSEGC